MTVYKWSQTAATNSSADSSINWAEGQAPSTVNDSARGMMAAVAKWRDDIGGTRVTTNTGSAYQLTTSQGFTGLASPPPNGTSLTFFAHATNGTNATLSIDSGTAYPLQTISGTAAPSGIMVAFAPYSVTFNLSALSWVLNNVYNAPIPANTITLAMMQSNSVDAGKIVDGSVGTLELATNSVTTVKITDANVTLPKIVPDGGNKGKVIGYDYSTGAATPLTNGGPLLHVREQLATNTIGGGTFTAGAYRQRPLSTVVTNEIAGTALASNQITGLPAGTYMCIGYTTAVANSASGATASMRAKLQNITGAATLILGSTEASFIVNPQSSSINLSSKLYGRFTLAAPSTIEVQGWFVGCAGGLAVNSGDSEVYTDLLIWRLA